MNEEKPFSIKLEKYQTRDINDKHVNGSLTVVWRDYDSIIKNQPKMVYVSSVNPGEIKGPHLHTKRNSYFVCIHGKVVFVIKDQNRQYIEIESSDDDPNLVFVPKNFPSAHINLSNETSRVLTLADLSWRKDDNEMKNVSYDDYNWKKWNLFRSNQRCDE